MTRVGWVVLAIVLLVAGLFAATLSIGGSGPPAALPMRVLPKVAQAPATDANGLPLLRSPVAGVARGQIVDTWGDARGQGRTHHGTDITAAGGTRVLAVAPGTVEKLFHSDRGGTTLYERSIDRRWTFYYAHLQGYAPGLHEGQAVRAGDLLGYVGDTGDAGVGNYHLHFSAARLEPGQHWWQGEDVNAYPMLTGR